MMSDEPKPDIEKIATELTKKLADDGKIVAGGWVGFAMACKLGETSPLQQDEMRKAFFAGAMHVFQSIMSFLEPGSEPTEKDADRMTQLSDELTRFQKQFEADLKARN